MFYRKKSLQRLSLTSLLCLPWPLLTQLLAQLLFSLSQWETCDPTSLRWLRFLHFLCFSLYLYRGQNVQSHAGCSDQADLLFCEQSCPPFILLSFKSNSLSKLSTPNPNYLILFLQPHFSILTSVSTEVSAKCIQESKYKLVYVPLCGLSSLFSPCATGCVVLPQ